MGFHRAVGKGSEQAWCTASQATLGKLARKATLGFVTLGAVRGQGKCLPDVFRKILREGEVKARLEVRTEVG